MRKILDKPMTWGGYLGFCAIMILCGMISMIPYFKWLGVNWKDCLPECWKRSKKGVE